MRETPVRHRYRVGRTTTASPEESVEFAAHCCGCDAMGEPHPLAEVAESLGIAPAKR